MAERAKSLSQFRINPKGEGYELHIEDDAGETIEFEVTRDQLDVIVDHLDDILEEDDSDV
jgi:hypothetical protein